MCHSVFGSPASLASHLNHPQQSCSLVGANDIPYPTPPGFYACTEEDVTGHYHEKSGYIYGQGETILDKFRVDEHERHWEHIMHYPFTDEGEWELAKFLAHHLNQAAINEFLKLKWVRVMIIELKINIC